MIIPIRTAVESRRTPMANYVLIGLNVMAFFIFGGGVLGDSLASFRSTYLEFQSTEPGIWQFFGYQFVHGDKWHLIGNMWFLWLFGNAVNSKMGDIAYSFFYLAGGVFSAWGYATANPEPFVLVGASGSIAAVTTAYLVLFPRSRVTVLFWFFFIHLFELPALALIGLKIIIWDNFVAPGFGGASQVAYGAHIAGYFFGFVGAMFMLLIRALPRDQFDLLSLWKRWNQRREFASAMENPEAQAKARYGSAGRAPRIDPEKLAAEERQLDKVSELRSEINEAMENRDLSKAVSLYESLVVIDPKQCMAEMQQLDIGREFYRTSRSPQAVAAFERFVACYPHSREKIDIRLLLGIIYARDLKQFETADTHLTQTMDFITDEGRKKQCLDWLRNVRAALGKPAPEG